MSKNKNLHEIIYHDNGSISVGNYINVVETGVKDKGNHKLYFATCKTCGKTITKNINDLKRMSLKCLHSSNDNSTVHGIGINDMPKGWLGESELNFRIYDLWRHMLLRTTEKFWEKYPTYKDTTVCEEWKHLSNFAEDIKDCEGYEYWINNPNQRIMLDKDTKIIGNKCYCKENCCFISHADSNRDVYKRHPESQLKAAKACGQKYGVSITAKEITTGEMRIFSSQKEAGRELGVLASHIWMILSDDPKYISHKSVKTSDGKQWTFEKT